MGVGGAISRTLARPVRTVRRWFCRSPDHRTFAYDELLGLLQAEVERGVADAARRDGVDGTGAAYAVERVELELPVDTFVNDAEDGVERQCRDCGERLSLGLGVTPGEGDGTLTVDFTPNRRDSLDSTEPPMEGVEREDEPLEDAVAGLGRLPAERLRERGIETVTDLASADVDQVAAVLESDERASRVITGAKLRELGVEKPTARVLAAVGYGPDHLADADPTAVVRVIETAIEDGNASIPEGYEIDYGAIDAAVDRAAEQRR